jgi:predicted  nucleic acid-binding Zn-ribbon protein
MTNELIQIRTRCNQIEQQLSELSAGAEFDALEQELANLEEGASDLAYDLEHRHERD